MSMKVLKDYFAFDDALVVYQLFRATVKQKPPKEIVWAILERRLFPAEMVCSREGVVTWRDNRRFGNEIACLYDGRILWERTFKNGEWLLKNWNWHPLNRVCFDTISPSFLVFRPSFNYVESALSDEIAGDTIEELAVSQKNIENRTKRQARKERRDKFRGR